jgi:hypothetical protein
MSARPKCDTDEWVSLLSERKAAEFLGIPCKELKRLRRWHSDCGEDWELKWFRYVEGIFYIKSHLEKYRQS